METWEVNLKDARNSTLFGDIGEAVALHYLTRHYHGYFIVTRPIKFLHGELSLISAHYHIKPPRMDRERWLDEKQKEYLENSPSWDYVAFKPVGFHIRIPYLIEVKTVKGKERPHKKPKPNVVSEAKKLGFKPIMVIVRLLEDWNISVQANEL